MFSTGTTNSKSDQWLSADFFRNDGTHVMISVTTQGKLPAGMKTDLLAAAQIPGLSLHPSGT
jgi:hypothetical protein